MRQPRLAKVDALPGFRLAITWDNGQASVVDVSDVVTRLKVFRPIRESPTLFEAVTIGEYAYCAHWSDEMELSAPMLWDRAQAQAA